MNLNGKILRNINTPNVGIFVRNIYEEAGELRGKVSYFPLEGSKIELNMDGFVKDNYFFYQTDRFYNDFEVLYNVDEIKSFDQAEWAKMGPL